MKRSTLDEIARAYRLDPAAISVALAITGSTPDAAAWRTFAVRMLGATGIAALSAGAIFFIAANWQRFELLGRFALLEAVFLAAAAIAWWRPPPRPMGRNALVAATLLAGGLLALFGQTYQTGADLHELFVAWAALCVPFALAGRSGAVWAIWWIVLNVALALFCGWLGPDHFMWEWLARRGAGKPLMLLLPCAVNLGGAALFGGLARTRFSDHAPRWLVRLLLTFAFVYGTAATLAVVTDRAASFQGSASGQGEIVVLAFAAVSLAIGVATLRARHDVFPMALVIASWIAISTTQLVNMLKLDDAGGFFLLTLWLIATSSAAAYALMRWVRAWRIDEEEAPEAAA